MNEDEILATAAATISSVWGLEVLLLLAHQRRAWNRAEIVREVRGSAVAVEEALASLRTAAFVAEDEAGLFRFSPSAPKMEEFVSGLSALYATKPVAVIRAIATSPNEKLRLFSDAFRFKD